MDGGHEIIGLDQETIARILQTADHEIQMYLAAHEDTPTKSYSLLHSIEENRGILHLDEAQYQQTVDRCRTDTGFSQTVMNALRTQTSLEVELAAQATYGAVSQLVDEQLLAQRTGQVHIEQPGQDFTNEWEIWHLIKDDLD
jgi:predicted lactoylglutathione lyase